LSEAKEAFGKKEYEKAARLADRASIDAELARNKAVTEKAKKNAEEMRKNIEACARRSNDCRINSSFCLFLAFSEGKDKVRAALNAGVIFEIRG